MRTIRSLAIALVVLAVAVPSWAQEPVTASDIARLEVAASDIRGQIGRLRSSDATLAADVERSLADLDDEVTYLRVKLRREGTVTRGEYVAVRDRL
jgi:hypothetical protein